MRRKKRFTIGWVALGLAAVAMAPVTAQAKPLLRTRAWRSTSWARPRSRTRAMGRECPSTRSGR